MNMCILAFICSIAIIRKVSISLRSQASPTLRPVDKLYNDKLLHGIWNCR